MVLPLKLALMYPFQTLNLSQVCVRPCSKGARESATQLAEIRVKASKDSDKHKQGSEDQKSAWQGLTLVQFPAQRKHFLWDDTGPLPAQRKRFLCDEWGGFGVKILQKVLRLSWKVD